MFPALLSESSIEEINGNRVGLLFVAGLLIATAIVLAGCQGRCRDCAAVAMTPPGRGNSVHGNSGQSSIKTVIILSQVCMLISSAHTAVHRRNRNSIPTRHMTSYPASVRSFLLMVQR